MKSIYKFITDIKFTLMKKIIYFLFIFFKNLDNFLIKIEKHYLLKNVKFFFKLLLSTFNKWNKDKVPRLGAALAFYSILSLAPIIVLIIIIISTILGNREIKLQFLFEVRNILGDQIVLFLKALIENASKSEARITATTLSIFTIIFTSSMGINYLKSALNTIYEVKIPPKKALLHVFRIRMISILIVVLFSFIITLYLFSYPILVTIKNMFGRNFSFFKEYSNYFNVFYNFLFISFMFTLTFKFLPDRKTSLKISFLGGIFTGVLFILGNSLIKLYLSKNIIANVYGAAGTLVIMLLWVYYIAQITFFGAEFTYLFHKEKKYYEKIKETKNKEVKKNQKVSNG